jgi:hypothetical protein
MRTRMLGACAPGPSPCCAPRVRVRPTPTHAHHLTHTTTRCHSNTGHAGLGASAPLGKFQHPSHSLLEQHGFKQMVYKKYYKRCLEDRSQKGALCLGVAGALGTSLTLCAPVADVVCI